MSKYIFLPAGITGLFYHYYCINTKVLDFKQKNKTKQKNFNIELRRTQPCYFAVKSRKCLDTGVIYTSTSHFRLAVHDVTESAGHKMAAHSDFQTWTLEKIKKTKRMDRRKKEKGIKEEKKKKKKIRKRKKREEKERRRRKKKGWGWGEKIKRTRTRVKKLLLSSFLSMSISFLLFSFFSCFSLPWPWS